MSKTEPLDSDLYGDIYGDDDNDLLAGVSVSEPSPEDTTATLSASNAEDLEQKIESSSNTNSSSRTGILPSSLPAKPGNSNSTSTSQTSTPSLSYSAQIAQQFSAYTQTPSQERQQIRRIPQKTSEPMPISTVDSSAGSSGDTVFGKKPSEMHDAGKLFIGGLNWDTTDEGLRDYFSQFGKVDACTIMRDNAGTSRGFAFLTFEDPSAVNAVVAREHILDGKAIDPKRAIPREEHLRNTRYFVGGLAATTTSDSMKEFFSAYGKVVDATVMLDRESGRSKGFGFVTFEDATNSDQLVGKNLVLDDKQIEVKVAQPRSQREQAARNSPTSTNNNASGTTGTQTFGNQVQPTNIPFVQPQNPMMFNQRPMQMPGAMNQGMPMMNPMMMGMNMNMGFNPMSGMNMMGGTGMNSMGMVNGMNGMNGMAGMGGMSNMGGMRLGMGPIGAGGASGGMVMPGNNMMGGPVGMNMGMRPGMNAMGMNGAAFGRMATNAGPGPMRNNSRASHGYHPYGR
ncbi:hypothetical protein VKT23_016389 [Stygiomarasmius scandens]|uniref:RRM domain-containing protein n=1 Tax=Marasmiellus scandens TaxID=2682957 RepID=A0ABR1IXV0_9AGAR